MSMHLFILFTHNIVCVYYIFLLYNVSKLLVKFWLHNLIIIFFIFYTLLYWENTCIFIVDFQIKKLIISLFVIIKHTILSGWLQKKEITPAEVHPYFHVRDEQSVQYGIIFRCVCTLCYTKSTRRWSYG